MKEISTNCEECWLFQRLSLDEQELNRRAREITREGKEFQETTREGKIFPSSLNTLCGRCIKMRIINSALEEKEEAIIAGDLELLKKL